MTQVLPCGLRVSRGSFTCCAAHLPPAWAVPRPRTEGGSDLVRPQPEAGHRSPRLVRWPCALGPKQPSGEQRKCHLLGVCRGRDPGDVGPPPVGGSVLTPRRPGLSCRSCTSWTPVPETPPPGSQAPLSGCCRAPGQPGRPLCSVGVRGSKGPGYDSVAESSAAVGGPELIPVCGGRGPWARGALRKQPPWEAVCWPSAALMGAGPRAESGAGGGAC